MNILAVETSTKQGGIALMRNDTYVESINLSPEKPASEYLVYSIKTLLEKHGMNLKTIDMFAVGTGPGAFTGLRVGMSAVKTLAYHLQRPVKAVPSLDVLAAPFMHRTGRLLAVMDARKKEVYAAGYELKGESGAFEIVETYQVCSPEFILERFPPDIITGSGVFTYRDRMAKYLAPGVEIAGETLSIPDPRRLLELALHGAYPLYEGRQLFGLAPAYIRKSEAEVQWDKKHGSN